LASKESISYLGGAGRKGRGAAQKREGLISSSGQRKSKIFVAKLRGGTKLQTASLLRRVVLRLNLEGEWRKETRCQKKKERISRPHLGKGKGSLSGRSGGQRATTTTGKAKKQYTNANQLTSQDFQSEGEGRKQDTSRPRKRKKKKTDNGRGQKKKRMQREKGPSEGKKLRGGVLHSRGCDEKKKEGKKKNLRARRGDAQISYLEKNSVEKKREKTARKDYRVIFASDEERESEMGRGS